MTRVTLGAPAALTSQLAAFYGDTLGLPTSRPADGRVAVAVGETVLELVAGEGAPFYHLALLVPGGRFDEARAWAAERVALLPEVETGEDVFDFTSWSALACYFHDPAGSIIELIALAGIAETGAVGGFAASELVGVSEVGLVGDVAALAAGLERDLGLGVWDGVVGLPGRLAFVGERGRSLILCPPDRGWLPTGRPAEPHPVDLELTGIRPGEVLAERGLIRIRARPKGRD
jgi:hypothetical protein